ncbi:acyl-CoA thioesterase [Amycolatopsis sp. FU40]|uniref:acyl-CoA thioesterase n=1 Tax=Amycolatopsis sp. FU40 TaxID=2914159 RepID=UPI001F45127D|nr:thioesterase family protein [Amycolatopsis sp. FU40]UKD57247.1 acyl-CoA thioesterase [Amycolatopsis sp. FU40]
MTERRPIVEMPLRVRYHECDAQGIVFNAHYLAYADMAAFEVERVLFGSHDALLATGVDVVVAESNLRYFAPCRFDDELAVAVYLTRLGTTSMQFELEVRRGETVTTEIRLRYVFVDTGNYRKTEPPPDVRAAYAKHLPEAV